MFNIKRLRCFVGWLAILLPWIVVGLSLIFGYNFPYSISTTYYRNECITPFVVILGTASILLIYYDGYDKIDDILNTIAGILGLCVCFFPCWSGGTFRLPGNVNSVIHNVTAILFFALLAYISIFQFTKTSGLITKQKKIRNVIYVISGCGMLASFLMMLLPKFYIQLWLVETFALFFFGISWLTKANDYPWLAADPKQKEILND